MDGGGAPSAPVTVRTEQTPGTARPEPRVLIPPPPINSLDAAIHVFARKFVSQEAVLSRMQLTLHATRPTPHGASRLVRAMSAWSVKTRRASSRQCRAARVYGHTSKYDYGHAWHEYPPPPPKKRKKRSKNMGKTSENEHEKRICRQEQKVWPRTKKETKILSKGQKKDKRKQERQKIREKTILLVLIVGLLLQ